MRKRLLRAGHALAFARHIQASWYVSYKVHAGTNSLSRSLFRRRSFRRVFHPFHAGRFLPRRGVRLYRDGPQGIPTVRGRPLGWRRERHRGFQVLERSAPDLVVRPPSERLPDAAKTPRIIRQDHSGRKLYDPSYKSCTSFICAVARERFGFAAPDLEQLVDWANIIDGAQYPDAKTAVELGAPAMKLTLVIEGAKGSGIIQKVIGWMQHRKLEDIAAEPEIQALFAPAVPAAPEFGGYDRRACHAGQRRGFLRSDGLRSGRLQQVHPVLPVPELHCTRSR